MVVVRLLEKLLYRLLPQMMLPRLLLMKHCKIQMLLHASCFLIKAHQLRVLFAPAMKALVVMTVQ
jgi:hypothetical protein